MIHWLVCFWIVILLWNLIWSFWFHRLLCRWIVWEFCDAELDNIDGFIEKFREVFEGVNDAFAEIFILVGLMWRNMGIVSWISFLPFHLYWSRRERRGALSGSRDRGDGRGWLGFHSTWWFRMLGGSNLGGLKLLLMVLGRITPKLHL